jgi:hypothetical protein
MVRILNQTLGPSEGVGPELSGHRNKLITSKIVYGKEDEYEPIPKIR